LKKDRFILSATIAGLCVILILLLLERYILPRDKVIVRRNRNGQWQLLLKGAPSVIKGIVYSPVPIGQSHRYNFWADSNKPWLKDGYMMRKMGANTVRFFQPAEDPEATKQVIGDLYEHYGIRSIMGHWMDYWQPGNYADPQYREALTRRVLEMVKTYKDEEGILMWVLGNENNLSWHTGARVPWSSPEADQIQDPYKRELAKAKIYYSLVNAIALEIKKLDLKHPVALGNADAYTLDVASEVCPDIDLVALTAYRGKTFGNLWREVKKSIDKPVLIMEFGCDSFNAQLLQEDQNIQAVFIKSQWEDIQRNSAGAGGEDNALGGCIFEWNDEWWKHDEHMPASWYVHNVEGDWSGGGYYFDIAATGNMNINEEWWGIVALSPELDKGINKRIPRKVYYDLKKLWRKETK